MLKKSIFFFLFFLICYIYNQNINYEEACTNIYYPSRKDCTVAPWEENRRCCYISYEAQNGREGKCVFLNDTKSELKSKKKEYEESGKKSVKIECDSYYLKIFNNYIILLFFIFYYCN